MAERRCVQLVTGPARLSDVAMPFCGAPAERRTALASGIDGLRLRMDSEPVPVLTRKVNDVVALGLDYFSRLTGRDYPMPGVRVLDSPITGECTENPPTLVLGRKASKVIVLHELVHHVRGCNGVNNAVYDQNPYAEEMATQFVSATVFSRSEEYASVVSDVYAQTPRELPKFKLDLMAFQEVGYAVRTIVADRMDLGSEKTQKTFYRRAVYGLSRDRRIPRHFDGFNRFEYLRYPLGRALGVVVYSQFLDIEETSRNMLLMTQEKLTDLILSAGDLDDWKARFFGVVEHLKSRLDLEAHRDRQAGALGIYMRKERSLA